MLQTGLLSLLSLLVLSWTVNADLPDIGVPNYSCPANLMAPSKTVPTNVHSVRPADIKVIAALGDSLTAGNGAGAPHEDPLAVVLQYRGLTFHAGGDKTLEEHATIPNILKKYNPTLFGYSKGIGSENVWEVSYLNTAIPGAKCWSLTDQAHTLVQRLKAHPGEVDFDNDWKLINVFIGGNDMCNVCKDTRLSGPNCTDLYIKEAIQVLHDNIPRAIVSIMTFLRLDMIRRTDTGEIFCQDLHTHECKCEFDKNFTNADMSAACVAYQQAEEELMDSMVFEDKDDFTFVVQPWMNDILQAPEKDANGYMKFFAPDCFHFSQYGHAMVSTWLWRNFMEPVGSKTTKGSMVNPDIPLACPDTACPFIRTVKNSKDCTPYQTPSAMDD